jgi:sugar phosphate isomerase/epimerase
MKTAFHVHSCRFHWNAAAPSLEEQEGLSRQVSQSGFDGLDISDSWPFAALDKNGAAQTRTLAARHGLAIPTISCMGKTLCHPELGENNLRTLMHAIDTAEWLGAEVLNIALAIPRSPGVAPVMGAAHSPGGSLAATDSDFAITALRLREVARMARDRGLHISVEMHDRSLADTAVSLLRILDEVDEPNVGANPDLCNGYRAYSVPPEPWIDALRKLAPRANLWHINNMQRVYFQEIDRAAFVERPLGEGDIDYRLALKLMRQADFSGWAVIEYKGSGDPFEVLAQGRRYFRKLTDAAEKACLAP